MKFLHSRAIKEVYPKVTKITFQFVYSDSDSNNQSSKTFEQAPEHLAIFSFDCLDRECIKGGFDLSKVTDEMIKKNISELNGEISCQGWQDKERINKHRCWSQLKYKITANYMEN